MNGIKFLLDTNIIIGLVKGNQTVRELLRDQRATPQTSAYSFITRIELLSYPAIESQEIQSIETILEAMQHLPMTTAIEDMTIEVRRQNGLKIPDAIIAATSKIYKLPLITLDKDLANRMTTMPGDV